MHTRTGRCPYRTVTYRADVFYRVTQGPHQGVTAIGLGTLDDQSGLTLTRQWFFDEKPEGYTLAGEHELHRGSDAS